MERPRRSPRHRGRHALNGRASPTAAIRAQIPLAARNFSAIRSALVFPGGVPESNRRCSSVVEQLFRKQQVTGSNPVTGSSARSSIHQGLGAADGSGIAPDFLCLDTSPLPTPAFSCPGCRGASPAFTTGTKLTAATIFPLLCGNETPGQYPPWPRIGWYEDVESLARIGCSRDRLERSRASPAVGDPPTERSDGQSGPHQRHRIPAASVIKQR